MYYLLFLGFVGWCFSVNSQTRRILGTVFSASGGEPLIGVSAKIKLQTKMKFFISTTSKIEYGSLLLVTMLFFATPNLAQKNDGSLALAPWVADTGNGKYRNPVIYADYSDPDAIRVGDDYYMISSSFAHFPGIPILHSKDLVNWTIIGHAVMNYPFPEFSSPQHGNAVWAPSIRFNNNEFMIYFGDPDRGVFMTKAKNAAGPWEPLKLIRKVTGWIDCCPFWDEDGSAYLVHAFANSRSGIKSLLAINKMNKEGTAVYDDGIIVFNGQKDHPTMEGPKLYKRNGFYYIFAPAGGVKPGWQVVMRSKNIWGPYQDKITLEQGSTKVNGPHQGAWIDTPSGEDWFIHFQDRYAYGRVVHLQPVKWENDWPVMGQDFDGNGIGEPVAEFKKPVTAKGNEIAVPQTSDEFNDEALGLQWQWQANPSADWYSLVERPGFMRLKSEAHTQADANLWTASRLFLQKFPAAKFQAVTKMELKPGPVGGKAGLVVFGMDYASLFLERTNEGYSIKQAICRKANAGSEENLIVSERANQAEIYFRVSIYPQDENAIIPRVNCDFSYSLNGRDFKSIGTSFVAREGLWVGAKVGLFCMSPKTGSDRVFADFDWFRVQKTD